MAQEKKINGNTEGIRKTQLDELVGLYAYTQLNTEFLSRELMLTLAQATGRIGREISVYISRNGNIEDVSVGDANTVSMPTMRVVRNIDRLSGVRCIHTHPNGSGALSDVDIGTLNASRLDAMAALGVRDGKPTTVYAAFVGDMEDGERVTVVYGPLRWFELPNKKLLEEMAAADERLKTSAFAVSQAEPERAVLVGIENNEGYDTLEELAELTETAGAVVVHREVQRKRGVDNAFYIGSGKAEELSLIGSAVEADIFIFDDELTAIQTRNLEEKLKAPVIDRTTLILDIFAQRATSREGKLQVELAQLKYRLPRLLGMGQVMSRQGASGVGMRGPGETKLEIDRRRIKRRIFELEQDLAEVEKQRGLRKAARKRDALPLIALVGYTNAGKSTLLNLLSGSSVTAEDKLFATLDPVVRRITLPSGRNCLLSDTVGFINKLPHDLVEAFKSTLEEVKNADVILHIIDSSSPYADVQIRVVEEVLAQLEAAQTPRIEVYNKCDKADPIPRKYTESIVISAVKGTGIDELLSAIDDTLSKTKQIVELIIPYDRYDAMQIVRSLCTITEESHEAEGTRIVALADEDKLWQIKNALDKQ
ncbi:MAG TPA: GTPase HflX [Eubacteriales bacterium]|nr:GTPase HflX [Eubacteriales bacterium]